MFLKVDKLEKRKKKEVDAKHLLFFYEVGRLRSSHYPWFKGLPVVSLVVVKVFGDEGGTDAIFFVKNGYKGYKLKREFKKMTMCIV